MTKASPVEPATGADGPNGSGAPGPDGPNGSAGPGPDGPNGSGAPGEGAPGEGGRGNGGFDLTPRRRGTADDGRPPRSRRRRRVLALLVVAAVAGAISFALFRLVSDASLFFLNTDEAVSRRDDLGHQRFRMQGTPVAHSVVPTEVDFEQAVAFTVAFAGVAADVVHTGSPPDLFTPGVPVVLEGRWVAGIPADLDSFSCGVNDGYFFASDRMLVKHDNEYRDTYPERLETAGTGGATPGC